jgi:hypothetical protein
MVLLLGNIGAVLVAAHGKHKKSSLFVGGHQGGPYIFSDSALETHENSLNHQHYCTIEPLILTQQWK